MLLSDQLVPLETLALEMNVSTKTAKKYCIEIYDFLHEHNVNLQFKKGKGYFLTFDSQKSRNHFISEILPPLINVENFLPGKQLKRKIIMNILLLSEEYITINDIADRLFISRSAVNQVSEAVRRSIEYYYLKLNHNSHRGIKISGRESDLRYAICDNHEFFRSERYLDSLVFEMSLEYSMLYQKHKDFILNRFNELLQLHDIQFYPAMLSKIISLIIVITIRTKKFRLIEKDQRLLFLKDTIFYSIAKNLLDLMDVQEEDEIFWFALFLFANADTDTIGRISLYKPFMNQAKKLDEIITEYLNKKQIFFQNPSETVELSILTKILIKTQYHIKERYLSKEIFHLNKNNTFTYYLSVEIAMLLRDSFNLVISHATLFSLEAYFSHKFDQLEYPNTPLSVILLCPYFPAAVTGIQKNILRLTSDWIKQIEIAHFINNQVPYDIIINLTQNNSVLQGTRQVLFIDGIPSVKDYELISRNIFLKSSGIELMIQKIEMKAIRIDSAKNKSDIFYLFCLFQKLEMEESNKIINELTLREKLTSFENKTSNTILFVTFSENDKIHIVKHMHPFLWKTRKIQYFILFSINSKNNVEKLKMYKSIADNLVLQPNLLANIYVLLEESKPQQAKDTLMNSGDYWF